MVSDKKDILQDLAAQRFDPLYAQYCQSCGVAHKADYFRMENHYLGIQVWFTCIDFSSFWLSVFRGTAFDSASYKDL